jgi:hypothetical protein
MARVAVVVAALVAAVVVMIPPAAAQLPVPGASALPGRAAQATPMVTYAWYEPQRSEVDSGRGFEAAAVFNFAGPVKGRIQYLWPQSGDYSNIGIAALLGWGGPIYLGAGYERSSGHESLPVPRDISDYQTYAFAGLASRSQFYSLLFEVERSFGSELKGTTFKAGLTLSW